MKRQIYIEGSEDIINEILEIAKANLGEGINVIDLCKCIDKQEVIQKLKTIYDGYSQESELWEYIGELEQEDISL